jgi:outer membrane PBP1 activator LpoA protein
MSNALKLLGRSAILAILVAGCTPQPDKPVVVDKTQTSQQQATSAADILMQAINARGDQAATLRLRAANLLFDQQRYQEAANSLSVINLAGINSNNAFKVVQLEAKAYLKLGDNGSALNRLTDQNLPAFNNKQRVEIALLKANIFEQQNNPLSAVLSLSELNDLSMDQQQTINDQIWTLINQVDNETLVAANFSNYGFVTQGWIELALQLAPVTDLTTQREVASQWLAIWDKHPASSAPPESLATLLGGDIISAQRILIALPFSGPLAEPARIISEGVIAALKSRSQRGLETPMLVSMDTENANAESIIAYAVEQKADLVIGPLRGKLIDELGNSGNLPVPFITFNRTDRLTNNLFQLDLGSDQEIKQVVTRATLEGHKRFALITPAAAWGARLADDFKQNIEAAGAETVAELSYELNGDLSSQVSQLLNTDQSTERYTAIKNLLGESLEFDERPRRDIDALLLAAQPQDARQLTPMLAFHFAGDYPIYATSHHFEGNFNETRDVDLNRIQFPDQPWLLQPTTALNLSLALERPDSASRLGRLYALGSDAVKVYPFLSQLKSSSELTVQGETGKLSLDPSGRFTRELLWAQFDQGIPILLGEPQIPEANVSETDTVTERQPESINLQTPEVQLN